MQASESVRATILLAHGSRDPLWREPIETVAKQVRELSSEVHVRCAYLELTAPDLHVCVAELVAQGVTSITVLPLFLGMGKHARDDLPLLLKQLHTSHPNIQIDIKPTIGEQAQVIQLLARLALS